MQGGRGSVSETFVDFQDPCKKITDTVIQEQYVEQTHIEWFVHTSMTENWARQ